MVYNCPNFTTSDARSGIQLHYRMDVAATQSLSPVFIISGIQILTTSGIRLKGLNFVVLHIVNNNLYLGLDRLYSNFWLTALKPSLQI